jgi:DNA-binding NarL/FixJ family response regulator
MEQKVRWSRKPNVAGLRILLVEDDPLILMDLEYILEDAGVEVVGSCSNIKSALAKVASSDIEVAILDIRLGRESIAPVARELEKKGIPFVFYSGQVGSDPIRDEFPTIKILPKPAAARVIVAEIAALMHFGERPRSF